MFKFYLVMQTRSLLVSLTILPRIRNLRPKFIKTFNHNHGLLFVDKWSNFWLGEILLWRQIKSFECGCHFCGNKARRRRVRTTLCRNVGVQVTWHKIERHEVLHITMLIASKYMWSVFFDSTLNDDNGNVLQNPHVRNIRKQKTSFTLSVNMETNIFLFSRLFENNG